MARRDITFREANLSDVSMLLKLRDDPEKMVDAQNYSDFTADALSAEIELALTGNQSKIFLTYVERQEVGTVRFDRREGGGWRIVWYVAPEMRGFGLGKEMVKAALRLVDSDVYATIHKDQPGNLEIARFAGFTKVSDDGTQSIWVAKRG